MRCGLRKVLLPARTILGALVFSFGLGGVGEEALGQAATADGLRVFIDCGRGCDFDFLRREIVFVDYVRDRQDAEVHVLVTDQGSGAGRQFTLDFIGLGDFSGRDVRYFYSESRTNTDDETRRGIAQVLRVGFLHYIIETPLAQQIEIAAVRGRDGLDQVMSQPDDDPWDFWVFRVRANARASGEASRRDRRVEGSASANRTTEDWILRAEVDGEYRDRVTELSTGAFVDVRRSYELEGQVVKSLGEHWGASIRGDTSGSTYLNQDQRIRLLHGIEYNIFPYSESSRRSLTIAYEVGVESFDYASETIFGKTEETLATHEIDGTFDVEQPWGDSRVRVRYNAYLGDFGKYRTSFFGDLSFRIVRGFSVFVSGSSSLIRDQLYLTKRDLTDEEILIERRQLATDSRYRVSFGVSYTFGSIFNNVVNPRF